MKKILIIILCFWSLAGNAQIDKIIPAVPNPPRLINDYTGTLTNLQQEMLEHKLKNYDDTTSNQIVVVIVETLMTRPL